MGENNYETKKCSKLIVEMSHEKFYLQKFSESYLLSRLSRDTSIVNVFQGLFTNNFLRYISSKEISRDILNII